jgi:signal transduction histidine kinase
MNRGRHDAPSGYSLRRVRTATTKTALASTALVAIIYVIFSVIVVIVVGQRLTSDIDNRLVSVLQSPSQFSRLLAEQRNVSAPGDYSPPGFGTLSGPVLEVWLISTDHHVVNPLDPTAVLPAAALDVTDPETVDVVGVSVRVVGANPADGPVPGIITQTSDGVTNQSLFTIAHVVIGETMASVSAAQANVIGAEAILGPVLLACVFVGAVAIGRRVAYPVERARQRQMEFTADASHELRTPLSVIEAQAQLALSRDRDQSWNRAAFERVQGESDRMRRLVEDLLWLARFDATRDRQSAEPVDVVTMVQQAVARFMPISEARRITLRVAAPADPAIVTAPTEWLDRLIGVLLDNACKYTPEGGQIDVSVSLERSRLRLQVQDSGPGIPLAERRLIFDRFHRATDQRGGAGLGLAMANSIVQATGGRWEISDSILRGASMSVTWPRSP